MSAKSKRSAMNKDKIHDKKSAIAAFWNWGKKFNEEEKAAKEEQKAKFMATYGPIIDLAKKKQYGEQVYDREVYLNNL